MDRETGRVELVGGIALERCRHDEPEGIERGDTDDHEERMPREQPHEPPARRRPHAASARRRTHSDRPISTLAIPNSMTATLAAVPLEPFEKLLQMYSSITLDA